MDWLDDLSDWFHETFFDGDSDHDQYDQAYDEGHHDGWEAHREYGDH